IRAYNNPNDSQKLRNISMLILLDVDDMPYEEFEYFPGWNYLDYEKDDHDEEPSHEPLHEPSCEPSDKFSYEPS
ncbi:25366_t:CDS:2, partial [Gigaspora rosea]